MNVGESEVTLQASICLGSFNTAVSNDIKVTRIGIYEFVDSKIEARGVTRSQLQQGQASVNSMLEGYKLKQKTAKGSGATVNRVSRYVTQLQRFLGLANYY